MTSNAYLTPLPLTVTRADYELRAEALGVAPRSDETCIAGDWDVFDADSDVGFAHLQLGRARGRTASVESRDADRTSRVVIEETATDATLPARTVLLTRVAPAGVITFNRRRYRVDSATRHTITEDCPSYLGGHLHGHEGRTGWLVSLVPPTPAR
jgi:hypothetical protein